MLRGIDISNFMWYNVNMTDYFDITRDIEEAKSQIARQQVVIEVHREVVNNAIKELDSACGVLGAMQRRLNMLITERDFTPGIEGAV